MMAVVCAWCGRSMGEKMGPDDLITHGICRYCQNEVSAEIETRTSVCEIHGRYWPKASMLDGSPACPKCDRETFPQFYGEPDSMVGVGHEDAFPEEHDGEKRLARAEAYGVDR